MPYDFVVVKWIDASRLSDGWIDLAAVPDPYPHECITIGFLVSKNDRGTILVPTIWDVEHPANSHTDWRDVLGCDGYTRRSFDQFRASSAG
jgi:hypothetical protein